MKDLVFVFNDNGQTTLKAIIDCFEIENLKKVQMGISFVRRSGVDYLKPTFQKFIQDGGKIELLFGEDMNISESTALRELLKMGVILKVYRDPQKTYHPKLWIFHSKPNIITITGSSNISKGALEKNIEANIIIKGKTTIIKQQIKYFRKLWESEKSLLIDDEYIDNYKDVEKTKHIKIKYKEDGTYNFGENSKTILTFVDDWIKYIKSNKKIVNLEKWRGWYLLPGHGIINTDKLKELRKIIELIIKSKEYKSDGYASFSTSRKDIRYVNSIIKQAGITYKHRYTEEQKRDWFIRQHKNYLERLGLIQKYNRSEYKITALGYELVKTSTTDVSRLRSIYTTGLVNITWVWGNLKFFKFLVYLMSDLPDNRIYYHELGLIAIHSYHAEQIESIKKLILMFRAIPTKEKDKLIEKLDNKLKQELKTHRSLNAYSHYHGKIEDLLFNFGFATGMKYNDASSDKNKYIEIKDLKKIEKYSEN